ncbi:MAG TPA: redoxin domain-containing protein [Gemmatimonadales bacterium]|nr:redoxin domain-containing protein [Gemmatimonadales bacterium]
MADRNSRFTLLLLGGMLLGPAVAAAQQSGPLKVGDPAPDFTLQSATKDGVQSDSVRLSDLKDQTVVIAFFYKARTSG